MLRNNLLLFLTFFWSAFFPVVKSQNDSLNPSKISNVEFKINDLLNWVNANHPLVRIAKAEVEIGKAKLLSKRGAFDPTFSIDNNLKTLDNRSYYDFSRFALVGKTRS